MQLKQDSGIWQGLTLAVHNGWFSDRQKNGSVSEYLQGPFYRKNEVWQQIDKIWNSQFRNLVHCMAGLGSWL
jgi:hypothetical protein